MSASNVTPPLASHRLHEKVPFIAAWSGETFDSPRLIWRGSGRIGYANERPRDRDAFGVLWRRATNKPGVGKPVYGKVHHARQRRAMGGLLCQVCAKPTRPEATDDGVLFLLGRDEYEYDPWPAPIDTTHPPVCVGCATLAVRLCPHLRGNYVAVRCRSPRLYGVNGILHSASAGPRPLQDAAGPIKTVSYNSPRRGLIQAAQSVVRLDRYKLVDLEPEPSTPTS
jgi:hypothetical protein